MHRCRMIDKENESRRSASRNLCGICLFANKCLSYGRLLCSARWNHCNFGWYGNAKVADVSNVFKGDKVLYQNFCLEVWLLGNVQLKMVECFDGIKMNSFKILQLTSNIGTITSRIHVRITCTLPINDLWINF